MQRQQQQQQHHSQTEQETEGTNRFQLNRLAEGTAALAAAAVVAASADPVLFACSAALHFPVGRPPSGVLCDDGQVEAQWPCPPHLWHHQPSYLAGSLILGQLRAMVPRPWQL